jgi:transcriptional regulator with GAF, ATPase, and Fis domain
VTAEAEILVTDSQGKLHRRPLNKSGLSIGRHPSNDLVVEDPYVSLFHLQIESKDGRISLRDLGSSNGLRRESFEFRSGPLQPDQEIRFGECSLVLKLQENRQAMVAKESQNFFGIVSKNKEMQKLFSLVEVVALEDLPVLLQGETGSGKELFARALHQLSDRSASEFLALNCAALPKDLIESELFGHERGAFTSATHDRAGAFETAHGGSLFLDEIGELSLDLQAKLLRVLETGEFCRVGSHQKRVVNVRIVSATHRDLAKMVAEGQFREDLYYRLHVLPIRIPPLRDRLEDLALLVQHFTRAQGDEAQWSEEALEALELYEFPGNVRELKNIVLRALINRKMDQQDTRKLSSAEILAEHLRFVPGLEKYRPLQTDEEKSEKEKISLCLKKHEYNQSLAAKELGLAISSLHDKIKRYAISTPRHLKRGLSSGSSKNSLD